MLMPKRFLPVALALSLGACSLLAPQFNRPNVSVVSVELRGGNLLQQNFAVKLHIQNPNNRSLPVSGLHVALLKLANKMDQQSDAIAYEVTGSASVDLPFLRDLPFHQSGSFSLKGIQ